MKTNRFFIAVITITAFLASTVVLPQAHAQDGQEAMERAAQGLSQYYKRGVSSIYSGYTPGGVSDCLKDNPALANKINSNLNIMDCSSAITAGQTLSNVAPDVNAMRRGLEQGMYKGSIEGKVRSAVEIADEYYDALHEMNNFNIMGEDWQVDQPVPPVNEWEVFANKGMRNMYQRYREARDHFPAGDSALWDALEFDANSWTGIYKHAEQTILEQENIMRVFENMYIVERWPEKFKDEIKDAAKDAKKDICKEIDRGMDKHLRKVRREKRKREAKKETKEPPEGPPVPPDDRTPPEELVKEVKRLENGIKFEEKLGENRTAPATYDELQMILNDPELSTSEKQRAIDRYNNFQAVMQPLLESMVEMFAGLNAFRNSRFPSGGIVPTSDGGADSATIPTPEQINQEQAKRQAQKEAILATAQALSNFSAAISSSSRAQPRGRGCTCGRKAEGILKFFH